MRGQRGRCLQCLQCQSSFQKAAPGEGSTFEEIPFEVQRGEGGSLDGRGEVGPALEEGQGATDAPVSGHRPVHVSAEHKHRLILLWMQINGEHRHIQVKPEVFFSQCPRLNQIKLSLFLVI